MLGGCLMDSKPWYQSKGIWAAIIAAISGLLGLIGHQIDPGTQQILVNDISAAAQAVSIVSSILAAVFRKTATTTIGKMP